MGSFLFFFFKCSLAHSSVFVSFILATRGWSAALRNIFTGRDELIDRPGTGITRFSARLPISVSCIPFCAGHIYTQCSPRRSPAWTEREKLNTVCCLPQMCAFSAHSPLSLRKLSPGKQGMEPKKRDVTRVDDGMCCDLLHLFSFGVKKTL